LRIWIEYPNVNTSSAEALADIFVDKIALFVPKGVKHSIEKMFFGFA